MQFNIKQRRAAEDQRKPGHLPGSAIPKLKKGSVLAQILKRAQQRAKESGQPFEYLLDVDYLHDANNPLDNGYKAAWDAFGIKGGTADTSHPSNESPEWENEDSRSDIVPVRRVRRLDERPQCVTRWDPLATDAFTSIAPPGTPCMFGVDERDERVHCIMSGGEYGAYGWCYTNKERSEWGSCSEDCPLSGPASLLEKRIDAMNSLVSKILKKVRGKKDCQGAKDKKEKEEDNTKKEEEEENEQEEEEEKKEEKEEEEEEEKESLIETHEKESRTKFANKKFREVMDLFRKGLITGEEMMELRKEAESLHRD